AAPSARRSSAARWSARWSCWACRCRRGCKSRGRVLRDFANNLLQCRRPKRRSDPVKNLDLKDYALPALILICGGVAAALLALRGQAQALAPLALGATLGAAMMARFGATEEE